MADKGLTTGGLLSIRRTSMNIFEKAIRNKYRFNFRGIVSTEDLFDLNEKQLDEIFKTLRSQLKQTTEESLLEEKDQEAQELDIKIAIVKAIVEEKLQAKKDKVEAKAKSERKQKLLGILAKKQDQKDEEMSEADILKELEQL